MNYYIKVCIYVLCERRHCGKVKDSVMDPDWPKFIA